MQVGNLRAKGFQTVEFLSIRYSAQAERHYRRAVEVEFYEPANSQERFAVERIALAQLAILRGLVAGGARR